MFSVMSRREASSFQKRPVKIGSLSDTIDVVNRDIDIHAEGKHEP
jgi:hypothetical protein